MGHGLASPLARRDLALIRINLARPRTREGLDAAEACYGHSERWGRAGDSYARYAECAYLGIGLAERFEAIQNAFLCLELSERWERRVKEQFGRVLEGYRREAA